MPARARSPSVVATIALALIATQPGCGGDDAGSNDTPACGPCGPGMECGADGQCVCIPNASKWCDGHGTIRWKDGCGNLGPVFAACASGKCYGGECVDCMPVCGDRVCGDDGCGGSCGVCPDGRPCQLGLCCVPDCAWKACGDDGCGGSCGTCDKGKSCLDGVCACTTTCEGRTCGQDSCGNVCGTCLDGQVCDGGQCCTPSCDGKVCGDDGCGETCGGCLNGAVCTDGTCVCGVGCGDKTCGTDGCGNVCGTCLDAQICSDGQCCTPSCAGKACGDDGCGGSCGACEEGRACVQGACACAPACIGNACGYIGCGVVCRCDGSKETCDGGACVPCATSCAGRECGNSGCDRWGLPECGTCPAGSRCEQGQCVGCVPDCDGRTCGDDGCGGSCGTCPDGQACALWRCVCANDNGGFCLADDVFLCNPAVSACPGQSVWAASGGGYTTEMDCLPGSPCECGQCDHQCYGVDYTGAGFVFECEAGTTCCDGMFKGLCCTADQHCDLWIDYMAFSHFSNRPFCLNPGEAVCGRFLPIVCGPGESCCEGYHDSTGWSVESSSQWCCPEGSTCCGTGEVHDPAPLCCGPEEFCVDSYDGATCCKKDTQFVCDPDAGELSLSDACCDIGQECVSMKCVEPCAAGQQRCLAWDDPFVPSPSWCCGKDETCCGWDSGADPCCGAGQTCKGGKCLGI